MKTMMFSWVAGTGLGQYSSEDYFDDDVEQNRG
jgi:hypothetical protein